MKTYSMLSSGEKEVIESNGAHHKLPDGLYLEAANSIVLTVKGCQYFEYARNYWRLSLKVSSIKDKTSLLVFIYKLHRAAARAAVADMRDAYRAGEGSQAERESAAKLLNNNFVDNIVAKGLKLFSFGNVISLPNK